MVGDRLFGIDHELLVYGHVDARTVVDVTVTNLRGEGMPPATPFDSRPKVGPVTPIPSPRTATAG